MSSRKFTVFVDDDSTGKAHQAPKPALNKPAEEDAGVSSLSATEKENLHPLTGGRLRSSSTIGLKRKSSVLATKLHNPPDTKDSKQAPALVPSKKRKVTSLSDGETERLRSRARRVKPVACRRRSRELASIAEEKDERLARRLSHAKVDSRCYDSTVSPIANVSDTFGQLSPSAAKDGKTDVTAKRVPQTFFIIRSRLPYSRLFRRVDPLNQNYEITFALPQMQSPLPPLLPLSVVRLVEPHSLLQPCPPRRGSESTLPSHFHRRSGDLQNANANGSQPPHSKTCRQPVNLTPSLMHSPSRTTVPPIGPRVNRPTLSKPCYRQCCYFTFSRARTTLSTIESQERFHIYAPILTPLH